MQQYDAEEIFDFLISNDQFIQWVQNPNSDLDTYWQNWLEQHPDSEVIFEEAREFVSCMCMRPILVADQEFRFLKSRIDDTINSAKPQRSFHWRKWRGVAAAALVVICAWFVYAITQMPSEDYREIATKLGQKSSMILADGTKVWLKGGSKLRIPENFMESDQRLVQLEGEGYFEVTKNPHRPFLVQTKNMDIKVLGTSFNVRAYPEDAQTVTTLVEGKVEILTSVLSEPVVLMPDDQAVFANESIAVRQVDAASVAAWMSGLMIFEDQPFAAVCKELERWYGVPIDIQQGGECRISAKIGQESLSEVLSLLKLTSSIQYQIKDHRIKLKIQCE